MQYLLAIYTDERQFAAMSESDLEAGYAAYTAYTAALHAAGVFVAGDRLESARSATTVRVAADGKSTVLDGPYADTKEQLAGYYIIEAADVDAAISWAARCPGASFGVMEVRPIFGVPAQA